MNNGVRGRPPIRWLVLVLALLLAAAIVYEFLPFFWEDLNRKALEAGFSVALGREVHLEGPIDLQFSLQPTLVLEDFRIANPPWASRPDLIRANRLEAQVSFAGVLRREAVIEKIFLEGVDLLLEDGPNGSNNWTFGTDSKPALSPNEESPIPVDLSEEGLLAVQQVRISYLASSTDPPFQVTIIEGSIRPVDDRIRKISIRGTFNDVPFTSELSVGRILELFKLTQPWPINGVVSAAGTSLMVKGKFMGKSAIRPFDVNIALKGNHLSSLNPLLGTDLPSLGPYELAGALLVSDNDYSLKNVRAKIGQSDFAGDVTFGTKASRQWLSATLKSNTLQIEDFRTTESDLKRVGTDPSVESFAIPADALRTMDTDLELSVHTLLHGDKNLGSVSLNATLQDGLLSLARFKAESFGGTVSAKAALDVRSPAPTATFEAKAKSIDYGRVLDVLGITNEIAGSTDFDLTLSGKGATLHEFLEHVALRMNAGPTTLTVGKKKARDPLLIGLRQATLTVSEGGPVKVLLDGDFRNRPFKVGLATGTLTSLSTSSQPWPVTLSARTADASLTVKGGLRSGAQGMRAAFAVALKGRQLNRLDPDFPPKGPYVLAGKFTKVGDLYTVTDLKGRLAGTDIAGSITIDLGKPRPLLTGALTSQQVNFADLSTPGEVTIPVETLPAEVTIPVETLHAIDADLNLMIKRMTIGAVHLADLHLRGKLQAGRLAIPVQGKLANKDVVYGVLQGRVDLDTTDKVPVLSGRTSVQNLDYGHLLRNLGIKNHIEGVANLDAEFSGEGPTIGTMLAQSTFKIEGKDLRMTFPNKDDTRERTIVVTKAIMSAVKKKSLLLTAEGRFNDTPFTITSTSDRLVGLLEQSGAWPLEFSIHLPQVLVDLKGNLHLPFNGEDFSFQTLVKSERLSDLNFLSTTPLPDLGPFRLAGLLTQTKGGFSFNEFQGTLAESDVSGSLALITTGLRPHVIAKLESNTIDFPNRLPKDQTSEESEDSPILENDPRMSGTASSKVGKPKVKPVESGKEPPAASEPDEARVIPDVTFPVTTLREWDVDLDWHVKHVEAPATELDDMTITAKLEDGLFTLAPLKGTSWGGQVEIHLELDVAGMFPTLALKGTFVDPDLGRMFATLQITDQVAELEGKFMIDIRGRGHTLREMLSRANGEIEIVEGPFELRTKYIDLWASELIIGAMTEAWKKKEVTQFNCAVAYFDVENGIMKSDAILVDTTRLTIAGMGSLNLGTETIDLVVTPRPKDPTLLSLAHPVRLTGKLSDPDVTSDKFRIAESGGWMLLGLTNPFGLLIVVPSIMGTTIGSDEHNPCVEAMEDKHLTAKKVRKLKMGLFERAKNFFDSLGDSSDTSSENEGDTANGE